MTELVTYYTLKLKFAISGYGLSKAKKRESLVKSGDLSIVNKNGKTYYVLESVKRYINKIDKIRENYFNIEHFFENILGIKNSNSLQYKKFIKFAKETNIKILELDIPISKFEKYFINKDSIKEFNENFISLPEAYNMLNPSEGLPHFVKKIRNNKNITIYQFLQFHKYMYIKKSEIEFYKDTEESVNLQEVKESLGIKRNTTFSEIIKEYNIKSFRGSESQEFMLNVDFKYLLEQQKKIYDELSENYYVRSEIKDLFMSIGSSKEPNDLLSRIKKVEIPNIVRIDKFKGKTFAYEKREIDLFFEKKLIEYKISNLRSNYVEDYYKVFIQLLEEYRIKFNGENPITEEFWFKYIKRKINSSEASHNSKLSKDVIYKNTTKLLISFLNGKEIYQFNRKELDLILGSKQIERTYRKEINNFINEFNPILLKRGLDPILINPQVKKELYEGKMTYLKDLYSIEEYLKLTNFLSNYKKHFNCFVKLMKKNNQVGSEYCCFWLYILLHLNNCFRSEDARSLPILEFGIIDNFNIRSFDDLIKIKLSKAQVEHIVKKYQNLWLVHNKNKEEINFYCSEYLSFSFAYAVLCCEFVSKTSSFKNNKLINFRNKNNNPTKKIQDVFFADFDNKFVFKSRKMNRTVLTYISSIQKQYSDIDPTEVARHLRGHVSIETTNMYIDIPQEHFDFITDQLFDKGYFGYVYDMLTKLLLENKKSKIEHTDGKKILHSIKAIFGDVGSLENIAENINYIYNRRKEANFQLNNIDDIVLISKAKSINLGMSYAKEPHYQCLFDFCIAINNSCHQCPFAIPHLYALTTIFERISKNINEFQNLIGKEDIPEGEKLKIYNKLASDFEHVYSAIENFGEDIVKIFMNQSFDELTECLSNLPVPN